MKKLLHLWSVGLSDDHASLWITTSEPEVRRALAKAERFIAESDEDPKNTIDRIEYEGTIDA